MKYAVIGTGGIGGYYGSRLAQNGQDVHFLLHSDYEFVKETAGTDPERSEAGCNFLLCGV